MVKFQQFAPCGIKLFTPNAVYVGEWPIDSFTIFDIFNAFKEFGICTKIRLFDKFAVIIYRDRLSAEAAVKNGCVNINGNPNQCCFLLEHPEYKKLLSY